MDRYAHILLGNFRHIHIYQIQIGKRKAGSLVAGLQIYVAVCAQPACVGTRACIQ